MSAWQRCSGARGRAAAMTAACACAIMLVLLVCAVSARGAGSSAATASVVTPGQREAGNTGTVAYHGSPGHCGPETGEFWRLTLTAGDRVTVHWGSGRDYVTGFDIWPPGTADFYNDPARRVAYFSVGGDGTQTSTFDVGRSGDYILVFDDSCGEAGPYTFTADVVHACTGPAPAGTTLTLVPASGSLPTGSTATFTARVATAVVIGRPGEPVRFDVACGPDAGSTATAVTDQPGGGGITYRNGAGAGTDLLAVTVTNAPTPQRATASLTWTAPVRCANALHVLAFAVALRCLAATPFVHTILQVGECSVGVATFLLPATKLARLLRVVEAAKAPTFIDRLASGEQPVARLLYDLRKAYDAPVNPHARPGFRSFHELKDTFDKITEASELLRLLPDVWTALSDHDVSEIALDVANLAGLGSCVDLLSRAVAN
jgi:hypothetical protein